MGFLRLARNSKIAELFDFGVRFRQCLFQFQPYVIWKGSKCLPMLLKMQTVPASFVCAPVCVRGIHTYWSDSDVKKNHMYEDYSIESDDVFYNSKKPNNGTRWTQSRRRHPSHAICVRHWCCDVYQIGTIVLIIFIVGCELRKRVRPPPSNRFAHLRLFPIWHAPPHLHIVAL